MSSDEDFSLVGQLHQHAERERVVDDRLADVEDRARRDARGCVVSECVTPG